MQALCLPFNPVIQSHYKLFVMYQSFS